ncbi:MAG: hypothetical protein INH41_30875 [Myxococcaceae bacterium]|nr:hypothetical protein [Myxococcaceae bacterium]MCA3016810.1 hypothetical protein [Myxococcaceae bacterium]
MSVVTVTVPPTPTSAANTPAPTSFTKGVLDARPAAVALEPNAAAVEAVAATTAAPMRACWAAVGPPCSLAASTRARARSDKWSVMEDLPAPRCAR